jgi:acetolactate synthase-1/2/3 large subunit
LGSALGAKLAAPDRTVIACLGDGSYVFSNPTACHWTATVYKIPILTVIFNNACYGAVRRSIQRLFPNGWSARNKSYLGTDLDPPPRFAKVAEANGGYGETVEAPSNIKAALLRGLDTVRKEHKQALVDIICKKP